MSDFQRLISILRSEGFSVEVENRPIGQVASISSDDGHVKGEILDLGRVFGTELDF